jgi:alkanesulfonate monooxygenase SsuD/methylene tetrahydromethanopterin reductase-like flavin-dependent oxidoreductase (luciferase family)
MQALRRTLHQGGEDFPELLEELRGYLEEEKPGQLVKAIPGQGSEVPITLLGSSGFSAQLAGRLGLLPYHNCERLVRIRLVEIDECRRALGLSGSPVAHHKPADSCLFANMVFGVSGGNCLGSR